MLERAVKHTMTSKGFSLGCSVDNATFTSASSALVRTDTIKRH